jgi:hypothetical protein
LISNENLIEEFIAVSNRLRKIPSDRDFGANSKYSIRPYRNRFGRWLQVVDYMIKNYKDKFNFRIDDLPKNNLKEIKHKKLMYSCPLLYEPTNEMETLVAFSYLARELGYEIESVQAAFPDMILKKGGRIVNSELEYLSSNYLQHGHPISDDCILICWRKDIEIKGLEIFSLEEYLREKYDKTSN